VQSKANVASISIPFPKRMLYSMIANVREHLDQVVQEKSVPMRKGSIMRHNELFTMFRNLFDITFILRVA
jgi:hypothetical protein